jgi:3-phosphoglycerate kinase
MVMRKMQDLNVNGRKVLCRVDFNVSQDKKTGQITDDTRVVAALPTIKWLSDRGAKLILCSHLGRPKDGPTPLLSLKGVAENLSKHLGKPVAFAEDCVGPKAETAAAALKNGDVLLLENLRFHKAEEKNDPVFAGQLASLAEVYVDDAFGCVHRAHASVHGAAQKIAERGAGLLLQKEIEHLSKAVDNPAHPFVVILGGAKVSDKIKVIDNLLPKADALLIGGAMAYTFMAVQNLPTGKSLVEKEMFDTAKRVLESAKRLNKKFLLPVDHVVAANIEPNVASQTVPADGIPADLMALDVGPKTVELFKREIAAAKLVVWNGPLGVFETKPFDRGTFAIAKAVADSAAESVVGGGESVSAVKKAGVQAQITHVSTGGGASLEYLEGVELPGVAVLLA